MNRFFAIVVALVMALAIAMIAMMQFSRPAAAPVLTAQLPAASLAAATPIPTSPAAPTPEVAAAKIASQTPPAPIPLASIATAQEIQAIFEAVQKDDVDLAQKLLARNPKLVQVRGRDQGETPLHQARSTKMAQLLLDNSADPTARDRRHNATPARWAVAEWRPEVADLLEQHGGGDQDIFYYASAGHVFKLTEAIVKDPMVIGQPSPEGDVLGGGRSLMHLASQFGQTKVVEALLQAGAEVNCDGGWNNMPPIEHAAWAGFADTVKLLVEHGADLEARDSGAGHATLWYACVTGRKDVVAILLKAGAKPEPGILKAMRGTEKSPYYGRNLPPRADYDAVVELLKQNGAKD